MQIWSNQQNLTSQSNNQSAAGSGPTIPYGGHQLPVQPVQPGQVAPDGRPVNMVAYNPQQGQLYDPEYWTREAQRRAVQVSNGQRPDYSARGGVKLSANNVKYNPETGTYSVMTAPNTWESVASLNDLKAKLGTEFGAKPEWQWAQEKQQADQGYLQQQENNIGLQYNENTGSWEARYSPTEAYKSLGTNDISKWLQNPYAGGQQVLDSAGNPIANHPNYFALKYDPGQLEQMRIQGERAYNYNVNQRVNLAGMQAPSPQKWITSMY